MIQPHGLGLGYNEDLATTVTANSGLKKTGVHHYPSLINTMPSSVSPPLHSSTSSAFTAILAPAVPVPSPGRSPQSRCYTQSPDLERPRPSLTSSETPAPSRRGAIRHHHQNPHSLYGSSRPHHGTSSGPRAHHRIAQLRSQNSHLPTTSQQDIFQPPHSPHGRCGPEIPARTEHSRSLENTLQIPDRPSSHKHGWNVSAVVADSFPHMMTQQPMWSVINDDASRMPSPRPVRTSFYRRQQEILNQQMQLQHRIQPRIAELDGTAPVNSNPGPISSVVDIPIKHDPEMPLSPPSAYSPIHSSSATSLPIVQTPSETVSNLPVPAAASSSSSSSQAASAAVNAPSISQPAPSNSDGPIVTQKPVAPASFGAHPQDPHYAIMPMTSWAVVAEDAACVIFAAADYAETDSEEEEEEDFEDDERGNMVGPFGNSQKAVERNMALVSEGMSGVDVGAKARETASGGLEGCSGLRQRGGSVAEHEDGKIERGFGGPFDLQWSWQHATLGLWLEYDGMDMNQVELALARGRRASGESFTSSVYSDELEYDAALRRLQQERADQEARERMVEIERQHVEQAALMRLMQIANEDTETETETESEDEASMAVSMAGDAGRTVQEAENGLDTQELEKELDGQMQILGGVKQCTEAGDTPLQTPADRSDSATEPPPPKDPAATGAIGPFACSASPPLGLEAHHAVEQGETGNNEKQVLMQLLQQSCSRDAATPAHHPMPSASGSSQLPVTPSSFSPSSSSQVPSKETKSVASILTKPAPSALVTSTPSIPSIFSPATLLLPGTSAATASLSPLITTIATTTFALTSTTTVSVSPLSPISPSTPLLEANIVYESETARGSGSVNVQNETQTQEQQVHEVIQVVTSTPVSKQSRVDDSHIPSSPSSTTSSLSSPPFHSTSTVSSTTETSETHQSTAMLSSTLREPPTANTSKYTAAVSPSSNTESKTTSAISNTDFVTDIDFDTDTDTDTQTDSAVPQPILSLTAPDSPSSPSSKLDMPPLNPPTTSSSSTTPPTASPQHATLSLLVPSSASSLEPPSPAFSFCAEELSVRPLTIINSTSTPPPITHHSSRRPIMTPPALVLAAATPTPHRTDSPVLSSPPFTRPSSLATCAIPPPLGSPSSRTRTPPCDTPATPPPPPPSSLDARINSLPLRIKTSEPSTIQNSLFVSSQPDLHVLSVPNFKPETTTPKHHSQPLATRLEGLPPPLLSTLSTPRTPPPAPSAFSTAPRSSVVSFLSSGTPEPAYTLTLRPWTPPERTSALRQVTDPQVSYFDTDSSSDDSDTSDSEGAESSERARALSRLFGARRKSLTTGSVPAHARLSIVSGSNAVAGADKRRSNSQKSDVSSTSLTYSSGTGAGAGVGAESEPEGAGKGLLGKANGQVLGMLTQSWFLSRKQKEERKRKNMKKQIRVLHETGRS